MGVGAGAVRMEERAELSEASAAGSLSPRAIRAARGARATVCEAGSAGGSATERGGTARTLSRKTGGGRPFRRERVLERRPGCAWPQPSPQAPRRPRARRWRRGSRTERGPGPRRRLKRGRVLRGASQNQSKPKGCHIRGRASHEKKGRLWRPRPATGFRDSVLTKCPRQWFSGGAGRSVYVGPSLCPGRQPLGVGDGGLGPWDPWVAAPGAPGLRGRAPPPAPCPAPVPPSSGAARWRAGRPGASSPREQRTQRKGPPPPPPGPPRGGAARLRGLTPRWPGPPAGWRGRLRAARGPAAGGGSYNRRLPRSPRPENRSSSRSPDNFDNIFFFFKYWKQEISQNKSVVRTRPGRPSLGASEAVGSRPPSALSFPLSLPRPAPASPRPWRPGARGADPAGGAPSDLLDPGTEPAIPEEREPRAPL